MDNALIKLSEQGIAGIMLVLFVLAIIWLAKNFKLTSDDNTSKLFSLTEMHKKEIIAIYEKTIILLKDERDAFTRVIDDNTKAINNLAERLKDIKDN